MSAAPGGPKRGRARPLYMLWLVVLAAIFAGLFVGFMELGNWQVRRLAWKVDLIDRVNSRIHATPVAAPGPAAWPSITPESAGYRRVRVQGYYLYRDETLVHASTDLGYGYWLLTPMQTTRGFIVLINRGFILASMGVEPALGGVARPRGQVSVTGLLRISEPGGTLLRNNRPAQGQWYSRDVSAIARQHGLTHVAPYFIDAGATSHDTGKWPVGGLTKVHFRNTHLSYAITWYALAFGTLLAAGIVARYEWRKRRR